MAGALISMGEIARYRVLGVTLLGILFGCLIPCFRAAETKLRFNERGTFKILQVADMHYGNGRWTSCSDVRPTEHPFCSDLNSTAFVRRLIQEESPDLIVFTGDNIDSAATDARRSMDEVFSPAIEAKIPWAAILGNHDVESNLRRWDLMEYISQMGFSLSKVQDPVVSGTDGWGNYYLQVIGPGQMKSNSLLNLYFLDSGDNSKFPGVKGYDWIRASQIGWFSSLSKKLKEQGKVPALAYFHIPLPEYDTVLYRDHIVGVQQEDVYSPPVNSGFFSKLLEEGDVRATFVGHDHVNDYCGKLMGIHLCYGGGAGYHAYGKVGWFRRARIVLASLERDSAGQFTDALTIETWKRLDDFKFSKMDMQLLYNKSNNELASNSAKTFAYRTGCCWPWTLFVYRQGTCSIWISLIYTGVLGLLFLSSGLMFLFVKFLRRYRFRGYKLVRTDSKVQGKLR